MQIDMRMPLLNDYSGLQGGRAEKPRPSFEEFRTPGTGLQGTAAAPPPAWGHGGPMPPEFKPPVGDGLGAQIRDYRHTLSAANADLTAQLKAARETLKTARESGDADAIATAQKTVDDLNQQIQTNKGSLKTVHDDVKELRDLCAQLTADMKARNLDAIQQDRDAITQQYAQVVTDIQG